MHEVPPEPQTNGLTVITSIALASAVAHGGPWAAGFGWLFFLIPLFWIGLFVLIFGVFGRRWRRAAWSGEYGHPHGPWGSPARSAESSLAERFALGEIDETEYTSRLTVLRANNGPKPPTKG